MEINYVYLGLEEDFVKFEKDIKEILTRACRYENLEPKVNLNIVLMKDDDIHQYNLNYRGVDRPTDVLSFVDGELVDEIIYLGDLMISVDAVIRQAKEYGHDIKREYLFLVTHGILHLLGYDHKDREEEKTMFDLQEKILEGIATRDV